MYIQLGVAVFAAAAWFTAATAQSTSAPWFGVTLPPALLPHSNPVATGSRGPAPAVVPRGEEDFDQLRGDRLFQDVEHIVGYSRQSREERELGGDQLWGRVTGFPSSELTIRWAAEELRAAGIEDVRIQSLHQEADASLWLPERWEVKLLGNPAFGADSRDVILETAMALAPSQISGGSLTAPLVYVGKASPAELMHIDVDGKIAIQHITPQAHLVFERSSAVPAARRLFEAGAVAVINLVDQPGNHRVRDFSNCGGPCFNLGGQDSQFLVNVMNSAAEAGSFSQLQLQLSVSSQSHRNLTGINAIAVIPGHSRETVVVNAHADAWFDGAGDNADGLAVLLGLARHFQAGPVPARSLVFVVSAGHHTSGLNGPAQAVNMNPDLFDDAVVIINLEHVAQRNIAPARFLFEDGYRQFSADSTEAPIVAGISNQSEYLRSLFSTGVEIYGTNFMSTDSAMASGEGGGYRRTANAPIVTTMQAPPLYHTSGEVNDVISVPGLERMARFMRFFIEEVAKADSELIGNAQ